MRRNAEKGLRGRAVLAQMRAEYVVNSERWDCPCLRWDIDLTAVRARDAAVDLFTLGLSAPKRALSLLGLGRAAAAAGDRATAAQAYREVREIWHRADPGLPGLAEASRSVGAP